MAGILYLYRLFVYHAEYASTSLEKKELLQLMARRLYRYITFPAMCASWGFGLWMITLIPSFLEQAWLGFKLLCVFILSLTTLYAGICVNHMETKEKLTLSSKAFRMLNEVPTLLMIIIVFLVVLKPF